MIRNPSFNTLVQSPGSVPGMTNSRSSKSSSFHSTTSDEGATVTDVAHFEDIGLEDNASLTATNTPKANGISATNSRHITRSPALQPAPAGRMLAANKRAPAPRRSFPNLRNNLYSANPRSTSTAGLTDPRSITLKKNHSTTSMPLVHRNRSISPGLALQPREPQHIPRPRRGSWQSTQKRKSVSELEQECDEDVGDDIPDGLVLDNVPISPRPPHERPPSRAPSVEPSPERAPKERVRSIGNGTPAVAQAQGSLRSPTWKSEGSQVDRRPISPLKTRSNSWNAAHADLSNEARMLTEKLEEHADEEVERQARRPSASARPYTWNSTTTAEYSYDKRERVKSSTPELPPLRRTDGIVDPLPASKEKEAVLSRTRPSWLPPKDPAEEKRHLKEYQRMMAASIKADERREASRLDRSTKRDSAADRLMHLWENDIIPRWNDAIRERRTRDLWWKGVAPRSRAAVWPRAIGNELGLTVDSYSAALSRVKDIQQRIQEDKADSEDVRMSAWFNEIRKDADEHTWSELRIFQTGGPLHESLVDVLSAYAMYRVDIGYVPGSNVCILSMTFLSTLTNIFAFQRPLPPFSSSTFRIPKPHSSRSPTY